MAGGYEDESRITESSRRTVWPSCGGARRGFAIRRGPEFGRRPARRALIAEQALSAALAAACPESSGTPHRQAAASQWPTAHGLPVARLMPARPADGPPSPAGPAPTLASGQETPVRFRPARRRSKPSLTKDENFNYKDAGATCPGRRQLGLSRKPGRGPADTLAVSWCRQRRPA